MKHILLTFTVFAAAIVQQVQASSFLPYLGPIRVEITNQQAILINAPTADKPLATALRKALLAIDRTTPTNLVNDTKTLATLSKTLSKTSLSNTFDPLIRTAAGQYISASIGAINNASNILFFTRTSGPRNAALNALEQLLETVDSTETQSNLSLLANTVAFLGKKLVVFEKLVDKALNAPAGPNTLSADFSASSEGTFTYLPNPKKSLNGVFSSVNNHLIIASVQVQNAGNRTVRNRIFTIQVLNLPEGTTTYQVGPNVSNAVIGYTTGTVTATIPPVFGFTETYQGDTGTLTITHNSTAKNVFGTFSFSGNGLNNGANSIVVTDGSFNVTYR